MVANRGVTLGQPFRSIPGMRRHFSKRRSIYADTDSANIGFVLTSGGTNRYLG